MLNKSIKQFFVEVMENYPEYILEYTNSTTHDNIIVYQRIIDKDNIITVTFVYKSKIDNCLDSLIIKVEYLKGSRPVLGTEFIYYIDNPDSIDINNIDYSHLSGQIEIKDIIIDIDRMLEHIKYV